MCPARLRPTGSFQQAPRKQDPRQHAAKAGGREGPKETYQGRTNEQRRSEAERAPAKSREKDPAGNGKYQATVPVAHRGVARRAFCQLAPN